MGNKIECWKENCKNEVEFVCRCTNPPIYSCSLHAADHLETVSKTDHAPESLSKTEHTPESLTILPNLATKKNLIDHLDESLSNLYEFREKTISDLSRQITLLNEKMTVTLNSFQEIIQKHNAMISQIKSTEVISKLNNNEINELLSLNPEESIKKLESIIDIFDESKFFINDKGKIKKVKIEQNQVLMFRDNTIKFVKADLNNYSLTEFDISLGDLKSMYVSMCLIPENSVFCYGNYPNPSKTPFIIDSNNNASQISNAPAELQFPGLIYYKDYVYVFGGNNGKSDVDSAFNYNLKNKKWNKLNSLPAPSSMISGIGRKNKILLSGYHHSKIYCYDIAQNIYIELNNAQALYHKIICGNKKNYYVIETGGNIYESNEEWRVWNTIGYSGIDKTYIIGTNALWKNKLYFVLGRYNLHEFDIEKKKIKRIKNILGIIEIKGV